MGVRVGEGAAPRGRALAESHTHLHGGVVGANFLGLGHLEHGVPEGGFIQNEHHDDRRGLSDEPWWWGGVGAPGSKISRFLLTRPNSFFPSLLDLPLRSKDAGAGTVALLDQSRGGGAWIWWRARDGVACS